jgi:hypothetical protein
LINQTSVEYDEAIARCKEIFVKKTRDYGTAWRILRLSSVTDQVYIKAQRIRSIEEKGTQKINESIEDEYAGIINYCVIALIQLGLQNESRQELSEQEVVKLFDLHTRQTRQLMEQKNHDYGEAWRDMRISTYTDLILMKLLRIRQIEDNDGATLISEGIDANFHDIINYSVFALIRLKTSI